MSTYNGIKHRIVTMVQKWFANPVATRLPTQTLLETTGRVSGHARHTPIGGRRTGNEFWFVSEHGEQSQYVRNIRADARVRVRLAGQWHRGTAHILAEDDPRARLKVLPQLNSAAVTMAGTDLLSLRVDLTD